MMVGNSMATVAASSIAVLLLSSFTFQVAAQSILVADFELNINIGTFSVCAASQYVKQWHASFHATILSGYKHDTQLK
jgi:hypothetical protein